MAEETQVVCRFLTQLPDKYRITDTPFAVPARLTRYGLSEVVNHLLDLEDPRPFDFLVEGQLVRSTLEKVLLAKGLSAESTVEVEYILAVSPPGPEAAGEHEDWVSSVDGRDRACLVTGSQDGVARLWNASGACIGSLSGHTQGIASVAVLPRSEKDRQLRVLTAGKDCVGRLWAVDGVGTAKQAQGSVTAVLEGHSDTIQCIVAGADGESAATGSWDRSIRLWSLSERGGEDADQEQAGKKQKTGTNGHAAKGVRSAVTKQTIEGHTGCVSAVGWEGTDDPLVYSASWDHSCRQWDAERGAEVQSYHGSKALYCMDVQRQGAWVALGGAEKTIRLWDPRMGGRTSTSSGTTSLVAQTGWVAALKWCPYSPHHLVSATYTGVINLWDVRGSMPLHSLSAHTGQVCGVDFHGDSYVASGGQDRQLRIRTMEIPT